MALRYALMRDFNKHELFIYSFHSDEEPRNHGGTGLMTTYGYNPNVSKKRYFNANEGKKAVAEANRIAESRGDTNDVGRFKPHIKVYMPELVKRNPAIEHGDGDSFLNSLYNITESSSSSCEAAIKALAITAAEISK